MKGGKNSGSDPRRKLSLGKAARAREAGYIRSCLAVKFPYADAPPQEPCLRNPPTSQGPQFSEFSG